MLSQGTASLRSRVSWTAYCSHAHDSMIQVIQGCISMLYLSMSPWGLFPTSYSVCLHGTLYLSHDGLLCVRLVESVKDLHLLMLCRFPYDSITDSYCTWIAVL